MLMDSAGWRLRVHQPVTVPTAHNRTTNTSRNGSTGGIHRVFVEDVVTLGAKYALAAKYGVKGVGFWLASGRWPDNAPPDAQGVQAMWVSVVDNFLKQSV